MLLEETKKLADRRDFAVITVSLDDQTSLPGLRKIIRDHRIKHPVLWFGPDDSSWGRLGWDIRGVPDAYLLDPQGNIVLHTWVDETFAAMANYIMDHPQLVQPYGMEWTHAAMPDGSYRLDLHLTSPTHSPLPVKITVAKIVKEYREDRGGEFVLVDPIPEGKEWNCSSYYELEGFDGLVEQATFNEFGDTIITISVPHVENAWLLNFAASITLPGTQDALDGKGINIAAYGDFSIEQPQPAAAE